MNHLERGPLPEAPPPLAGEITRWALAAEARRLPLTGLLSTLAEKLVSAGIRVSRMRTSVTTKHPEVFVRAVLWHSKRGTEVRDGLRTLISTPTFLESPVAKARNEGITIRCRLSGPDADLSYAICRELAEEGQTDYVVFPLEFGNGERTYFSFATDAPGGFSAEDLRVLEGIIPALAVRVEVESHSFALQSLLQVYLGQNAAARVLAGAFLRGTGEQIPAAIWYCDMRGFTQMADQRPASEVVRILDRFFEHVAGPIGPLGGEVLKLIGDAVLAIFPVREDGPEAACDRALRAAFAAVQGVKALNAEALGPEVDLGIGLHLGDVMYGNIGARDRLDFTVIGAVVNEVCRVEALCRSVGTPILMTAAFARSCPSARAESRGVHRLKGVGADLEVFSPAVE